MTPSYEPKKCKHCGATEFRRETRDMMEAWGGMIETEFAVICNTCEHVVAYWAYGDYDPSYDDMVKEFIKSHNPLSESEFNKLYNGDFKNDK